MDATAQGTSLGWLKGEVRDASNGELVPFARIEVLCGPELWVGMTDFDGQYTLRVPPGPFVIRLDAKGYLMYRTSGIADETRISFLNVDLERMKKLP